MSPALRRAHLSFAAVWAGETAFVVALTVVAFVQGGVAAVGVVTAVRMASAAVLSPLVSGVSDRVRRERVLTAVGLVRAVTLGLAAVLVGRGGPATATYACAVVATVALALFRPTHSALLPTLARSPGELTSANAVRGSSTRRRPSAAPSWPPRCWRPRGPRSSSRPARRSRCSPGWSSPRCRTTHRRAPPAERPRADARSSRVSPPSLATGGWRSSPRSGSCRPSRGAR